MLKQKILSTLALIFLFVFITFGITVFVSTPAHAQVTITRIRPIIVPQIIIGQPDVYVQQSPYYAQPPVVILPQPWYNGAWIPPANRGYYDLRPNQPFYRQYPRR